MSLPKKISIVEVGPRDGLQNETQSVSVETKLALIQKLVQAGLQTVEVGSLVNPKWVPQMANSDAVFNALDATTGTAYPVLVPNIKGMGQAIALGVKQVSCFTAASETFNQKNIACGIEESFTRISDIMQMAQAHDIQVRAYLSCIIACPYEGPILPHVVAELTERLLALGAYQVSLGDTIGVGTPGEIKRLLDTVLHKTTPGNLALHLHDTYGQALANICTGLRYGITCFDSSIAGLGGCPYAPGASGNVATEDVVYMLQGMGVETGIHLDRLIAAGDFISQTLGRTNHSKVARALLAKHQPSNCSG